MITSYNEKNNKHLTFYRETGMTLHQVNLHCHEGISCNHCSKVNFTGKRYKCLRCFDYDLCSTCYMDNVSSGGHTPKHPIQCIICRGDYNLYYGGEPLPTTGIPQSLTCPYCAQMGFTDVTLKDHVIDAHREITLRVICPICATNSLGDSSFMVNDLGGHLTTVHNVETNRRRISFNIEEHLNPRIASIAGNLSSLSDRDVAPAFLPFNLEEDLYTQIPVTTENWCPPLRREVIPVVRRSYAPTIIVEHDPLTSTSQRESTDPVDELMMQISRISRMNSGGGGRQGTTLQVNRADVNYNRLQAMKKHLFNIQGGGNVETPENIKQESPQCIAGYQPLIPDIINESETENVDENVDEERAALVNDLLYSVIFSKPQNITSKK